MAYHSTDSPTMQDDSPWLSDDEDMGVSAPSSSAQASAGGPSHGGRVVAEGAVSQQEWDKLSLRYTDEGYRQGITAGKEAKLQAGFDQGFTQASPTAQLLGQLRAIASSLLALLTTAAGAKHTAALASLPPFDSPLRAELVSNLREVVTALGKMDEVSCLPRDLEADAHAREHDKMGLAGVLSQAKADRDEMDELDALMGGVGPSEGNKAPVIAGVQLERARVRLGELLGACAMESLLPPPIAERDSR